MPRNVRRIVFAIFTILFFISAGFLIFYASGYRYHAAKRIIEKTGKLVVETEPKGARVLMGGRLIEKQQTPLKLSSLLSGEYEIIIEKDGFFPVSKRIAIAPGMSALVNDVMLIRKSEPQLVNELSDIFWRSESAVSVTYDSGRFRAVVHNPKGWSVVDESRVLAEEDAKKKQKFTAFRFSVASDELYASSVEGMYKFDYENRIFLPLFKKSGIKSFFSEGSVLYVLTKKSIEEYRMPEGKKVRELSDIPPLQTIEDVRDGMLAMNAGETIVLFDWRSNEPSFQYVNDAQKIAFVNREHFFSLNDFEVWEHVISAVRYTRQLVTRQSEPIHFAVPFHTRPFIVVVSRNGDVRLRLLAAGSESQEFSIAHFDRIIAAFLDQKETSLNVVGTYKGFPGLYLLPLIVEEQLFPLVK